MRFSDTLRLSDIQAPESETARVFRKGELCPFQHNQPLPSATGTELPAAFSVPCSDVS